MLNVVSHRREIPRPSRGIPLPRRLRKRLVRNLELALDHVEQALAGKNFENDHQRQASLAVIRSIPQLFDAREAEPSKRQLEREEQQRRDDPSKRLLHPEFAHMAAELLQRMQYHRVIALCEKAGHWDASDPVESFARYYTALFDHQGPTPDYRTTEEAAEHGRGLCRRFHPVANAPESAPGGLEDLPPDAPVSRIATPMSENVRKCPTGADDLNAGERLPPTVGQRFSAVPDPDDDNDDREDDKADDTPCDILPP
jgi:hypothetical protein